MRILAIEPFDHGHGHRNSTFFYIRCLKMLGEVTFVAAEGYLESCPANFRINFPAELLRHKTKLGARLSAIRILRYILKNICLDDYDAIVFLAYETIAFSICWPKNRKTFIFEHNNIANALDNKVKNFFYRRIPSTAVSLALQKHIEEYIQKTCGREAFHVLHPYYRDDVSDSGIPAEPSLLPFAPSEKSIIFSPSGSTPESANKELQRFASESNGSYYAICKGTDRKKTSAYETHPFFENYKNLMRTCHFVFVGAYFNYRISGVAYEGLSYGKPLILFDCLYARELKKDYPHLVFIINNFSEIKDLIINPEKIKNEQNQFLEEHSFNNVLGCIAGPLSKIKTQTK